MRTLEAFLRIGRPSRPPAPRVELPGKKGGPKPKSGNTRANRTTLSAKALPVGNIELGHEMHGLGNVRGRRPGVLRAQGLASDRFEPRVARRVDDLSSRFEVRGRLPTSAGPARYDGDGFAPTSTPRGGIKEITTSGNQLNVRGAIRK